MSERFRTLIYGHAQECQAVAALLRTCPVFTHHDYSHADTHEDFHIQLVEWEPNLTIVIQDGAAGMEGVYLVNRVRPGVPVFWFSDDQNFSMQSHRLECIYFSTKPVTAAKISRAVRQCGNLGIGLARG